MAAPETITLYNTSESEQHAYTADGKRYVLAPHEVRPLQIEVAQAFLTQRSKFVQTYQAVYIPPSPGEAITWIANATGNPFVPEKLQRTKLNRHTNIEEVFEYDNPLRRARPLEFSMSKEQTVSPSRQGDYKESFSHPPSTIKIPPLTRVPVPRSTAEWLVRRDAQSEEGFQRSLVECRGPSEFEPNESWPLDEMLAYAEQIDPKTKWKTFIPKQGDEHDKKLSLFKALFHRLYDETFALVDRVYFQRLLAERSGSDVPSVSNTGGRDAGRNAVAAGAGV